MKNHLRINTVNQGDGMFSKTGRITTEQHTIFNRKEHILENKLRYLRVSSFPAFERDLEQLALANQAIQLATLITLLRASRGMIITCWERPDEKGKDLLAMIGHHSNLRVFGAFLGSLATIPFSWRILPKVSRKRRRDAGEATVSFFFGTRIAFEFQSPSKIPCHTK